MVTIKTPSEIEKIRISNKIVAEYHEIVRREAKAGVTTSYLNSLAINVLKKHKAISGFKGYRGFPFETCISIDEEVVHGFPSDRTLKDGMILSVDFGVLKDGFYGDAALTIPIGKVTNKETLLIEATKRCLDKAIEVAKPGVYLGLIGQVIHNTTRDFGFEVVKNYVGHGIGKELHEEPSVKNYGRPKEGTRLKPGMVICIEPMLTIGSAKTKVLKDGWTVVTVDGSKAAHFEHCICITNSDPEVLSI